MAWLRSDWLKGVVLPVLLAALRACWVWTWLEVARSGLSPSLTAPIMPLSLLIILPLVSFSMTRVLLTDQLTLTSARLVEAAAGMAAIGLLMWWRFYAASYALWDGQWLQEAGRSFVSWESELPPTLIAFPFLIYLWLRGVLDGRGQLYREDAWNAFSIGFVALAVAGTIALSGAGGLPAGAYEAAFIFFGTGLAAVALASLESTRSSSARRGEDQLTLNRYWFISVASIIITVLVIGFVLSTIVSPQAVARMLRWSSIILDVLGLVAYYLILVVAFVVFLFVGPLITLLQRLLAGSDPREPMRMQMPDFQKQLEDIPRGQAALPPLISQVLPWLGAAVLIVTIGLIFAVALRRFYSSKDEEENETRESILTRSLLLEQLAGLGRRFRRARPRLGNPFLPLGAEEEARRRVRAAYQALLAATRVRGYPRRREQTPTEYRETLQQTWPDLEPPLDTLTAAYLKARYAATAPSDDEAAAARQAWDQMRPTIVPDENRKPENQEGAP